MKHSSIVSAVVLAFALTSNADLTSTVESSICTFVVGKIESSTSCPSIASDTTALAQKLLQEANATTLANWADNELVVEAVKFICNEAVTYVQQKHGTSPAEICGDLQQYWNDFRRRRQTAQQTATNLNWTHVSQMRAAWTDGATERYLNIRKAQMAVAGTPVAVFADGTTGYCFKNNQTGFYSCIEHGNHAADAYAANSSAAKVVQPCTTNNNLELLTPWSNKEQTENSGARSSANAGLVAAVVILSVGLVGMLMYVATLTRNLNAVRMADESNIDNEQLL